MAITPLSQAVLQGMDPNTYRPLGYMQTGNELFTQGSDSSPTSKWGAIGRLAQALSGSYLTNSSTSDLARTIAGGKKSATDQLMAAIEAQQRPAAIPSAPPVMMPSSPAPAAPPNATPQADAPAAVPGSPNAQVANRFPAEMSPVAHAPVPGSPNDQVANRFPGGDPAIQSGTAQITPPAAPATQVASADPLAAIAAATAPRGIRNNNALNIEDGPFAKSQAGYAGSDGRFAKFQTPDHGVAAANTLLDSYEKNHGLNTVAGIVGRWAPAADGNNVSAYAADVAGKLGLDPNAPIPANMRPQLIAAMAAHENGQAAPGMSGAAPGTPYQVAGPATAAPKAAAEDDAIPTGAQPAQGTLPTAQAAAASPGTPDVHRLMAVLQNPYSDDTSKALASKLILQQLTPDDKPAWGIVGKDKYNQPVYGYPPTREDYAAQPKSSAKIDPLDGLQGPQRMEALKQSDPARASQAQGVLDGRIPYPVGSRLNPLQQQLKEDVTQVDGNFTAAKWLARSNFEKSMAATTPSSFGGQVRSAGTVAKHLGDADSAISTLEKGPLGASNTLPILNSAKGFIRNQYGDKEYQDALGHYETARKGIADETATLLAGTGHGDQASREYWLDRLDLNKHSPTEVRGGLDEFRSLMNGRISNVVQEKDRVFENPAGTTDPLSVFGPKERDIMDKIQKHTWGAQQAAATSGSAASPAAPAGAPDRAALEAEMKKRGLLQ